MKIFYTFMILFAALVVLTTATEEPSRGKPWADGTRCLAGTSCTNCRNRYTWWVDKAGHHCGEEPCWLDGTLCGAGTTCKECCNKAYNSGGTKCGGKPWADGTRCLAGTSCNNCRYRYTWWVGKAGHHCGEEPCWPDGTLCGAGTTCKECCNKAYNFGGTMCRGKPWADGTRCLAGTSCNLCRNRYTWWVGKAGHHCGEEPCWPDRTLCGARTICKECCNKAYNSGGTMCGGKPWADGTCCLAGTACNLCRDRNTCGSARQGTTAENISAGHVVPCAESGRLVIRAAEAKTVRGTSLEYAIVNE